MEILASLGSLAMGVVILYVIVKLLSLPFKLVWNGIIGAMIWVIVLIAYIMTVYAVILSAVSSTFQKRRRLTLI